MNKTIFRPNWCALIELGRGWRNRVMVFIYLPKQENTRKTFYHDTNFVGHFGIQRHLRIFRFSYEFYYVHFFWYFYASSAGSNNSDDGYSNDSNIQLCHTDWSTFESFLGRCEIINEHKFNGCRTNTFDSRDTVSQHGEGGKESETRDKTHIEATFTFTEARNSKIQPPIWNITSYYSQVKSSLEPSLKNWINLLLIIFRRRQESPDQNGVDLGSKMEIAKTSTDISEGSTNTEDYITCTDNSKRAQGIKMSGASSSSTTQVPGAPRALLNVLCHSWISVEHSLML